MERAAKAVRRSGVKLLSLGGGHADLNVVISEQKDVKNTAKAFMAAQNSACQYLMKWAANEDNRAIQDVSSQVTELNLVWTEAQREFTEQLKDFKQMFELVLEGEKQVDQARNNLAACEHREVRIKKELKKAAKRATAEEIRALENRLIQAERQTALALLEVEDKVRENDAIKLVRFKDGLLKLSTAYAELGRKCAIVFEAQRDISLMLPDVHEKDLEDIKYTGKDMISNCKASLENTPVSGSGATKHFVVQAKERVRQYRRRSQFSQSSLPISTDLEPPPPYSPGNFYDQSSPLPTLDDLNNPIVDLPQLPRRDFDDDCDKDTHSITSLHPGFLDNRNATNVRPNLNQPPDLQSDYKGGNHDDVPKSDFHTNKNTNYLQTNINQSAYQNNVATTLTTRRRAANNLQQQHQQPLRTHCTSVRQASPRQPSLEVAEDFDWGSEDEVTTDDLSGAMGGLNL